MIEITRSNSRSFSYWSCGTAPPPAAENAVKQLKTFKSS